MSTPSNILIFRAPGDPIPKGKPVVIPLKPGEIERFVPRPQMPRADYLKRARMLAELAVDWGLTITIHPNGGVA